MANPVWLISSKDVSYSRRPPQVLLVEYVFGTDFDITPQTVRQMATYAWVEEVGLYKGNRRRLQVLVRGSEVPGGANGNQIKAFISNLLLGN